jgi:hypothetical protein
MLQLYKQQLHVLNTTLAQRVQELNSLMLRARNVPMSSRDVVTLEKLKHCMTYIVSWEERPLEFQVEADHYFMTHVLPIQAVDSVKLVYLRAMVCECFDRVQQVWLLQVTIEEEEKRRSWRWLPICRLL